MDIALVEPDIEGVRIDIGLALVVIEDRAQQKSRNMGRVQQPQRPCPEIGEACKRCLLTRKE